MKQRLGLIHTSPVLVPVFDSLCRANLPIVERFHMVDESLIRNTIRAGHLEKVTIRRLAAQIGSALDSGATAVLVTCSSIGPGVQVARQLFDAPIFRVDEAMAARAVSTGTRIGVLATLRTTLEPTVELLRRSAREAGVERQVIEGLCDGAFETLLAGDAQGHDRLVAAGLTRLAGQSDVVVLAQASMARVLEALPPGELHVPVLTSPELAIAQVAESLSARSEPHHERHGPEFRQ
jgi:Asp/Glu/hydantoin racemase